MVSRAVRTKPTKPQLATERRETGGRRKSLPLLLRDSVFPESSGVQTSQVRLRHNHLIQRPKSSRSVMSLAWTGARPGRDNAALLSRTVDRARPSNIVRGPSRTHDTLVSSAGSRSVARAGRGWLRVGLGCHFVSGHY